MVGKGVKNGGKTGQGQKGLNKNRRNKMELGYDVPCGWFPKDGQAYKEWYKNQPPKNVVNKQSPRHNRTKDPRP